MFCVGLVTRRGRSCWPGRRGRSRAKQGRSKAARQEARLGRSRAKQGRSRAAQQEARQGRSGAKHDRSRAAWQEARLEGLSHRLNLFCCPLAKIYKNFLTVCQFCSSILTSIYLRKKLDIPPKKIYKKEKKNTITPLPPHHFFFVFSS